MGPVKTAWPLMQYGRNCKSILMGRLGLTARSGQLVWSSWNAEDCQQRLAPHKDCRLHQAAMPNLQLKTQRLHCPPQLGGGESKACSVCRLASFNMHMKHMPRLKPLRTSCKARAAEAAQNLPACAVLRSLDAARNRCWAMALCCISEGNCRVYLQ